jgi:ABC-2 type transport system permease protein
VTTVADSRLGLPPKRAGVGHWLASFRAMLRWEITNMRLLLPITMMVQLLSGAGLVIGFGLLIRDMPQQIALFLSTGAVVITLILVGVVMGPQLVAQQKLDGSYDFMWSLPVPRSASTAAWLTLNVFIAIPGMVGALVVAMWRYDVTFTVSWLIVPAILLTLVCGTLLGYAMAHSIPNPEITQRITQFLIFAIFGFSPISYPADNLPGWLAELHEYLPFAHMANVVRDALTEGIAVDAARSYVVMIVWTVIAAGLSGFVLGRRK